MTDQAPNVTQADRDVYKKMFAVTRAHAADVDAGNCDDTTNMKLIARHRIASTGEDTADAKIDSAYYNGAKQAMAMAEQSMDAAREWLQGGCGGRAGSLARALASSPSPDASKGDTVCQECGAPNAPWFADNELWNRVMGGPDATDDPGGVLCPRCFIIKAGETLRVCLPSVRDADASNADDVVEAVERVLSEYIAGERAETPRHSLLWSVKEDLLEALSRRSPVADEPGTPE